MGIYADYLNQNLNANQLIQERKKQLARISQERGGRAILVFASALTKNNAPIMIDYDDIVPINDQLSNLKGDKIDIILETPGGYAEITEQIVEYIRKRFDDVAFIIPGAAMSAGTIMVMAGDDILMSHFSSLGPIDAQISQQGKRFSAHAFLQGLNKIKQEVTDSGILNKTFIPILQNISPGEIQSAENALDFAKTLVTGWLSKYKFKNWAVHASNQKSVSAEDRENRAAEIADQLCDHGKWKTHSRSISIDDLRAMKLRITDYTQSVELSDAIQRYFTLLKMFFDSTAVFKVYETPDSQIYRQTATSNLIQPIGNQSDIKQGEIILECLGCKNKINLQANFEKKLPLKQGFIAMPKENQIECPVCKKKIELGVIKNNIERQVKKRIVYE